MHLFAKATLALALLTGSAPATITYLATTDALDIKWYGSTATWLQTVGSNEEAGIYTLASNSTAPLLLRAKGDNSFHPRGYPTDLGVVILTYEQTPAYRLRFERVPYTGGAGTVLFDWAGETADAYNVVATPDMHTIVQAVRDPEAPGYTVTIHRISLDGSPTAELGRYMENISSDPHRRGPLPPLTLHGDYVYYPRLRELWRVPLAGNAPAQLLHTEAAHPVAWPHEIDLTVRAVGTDLLALNSEDWDSGAIVNEYTTLYRISDGATYTFPDFPTVSPDGNFCLWLTRWEGNVPAPNRELHLTDLRDGTDTTLATAPATELLLIEGVFWDLNVAVVRTSTGGGSIPLTGGSSQSSLAVDPALTWIGSTDSHLLYQSAPSAGGQIFSVSPLGGAARTCNTTISLLCGPELHLFELDPANGLFWSQAFGWVPLDLRAQASPSDGIATPFAISPGGDRVLYRGGSPNDSVFPLYVSDVTPIPNSPQNLREQLVQRSSASVLSDANADQVVDAADSMIVALRQR